MLSRSSLMLVLTTAHVSITLQSGLDCFAPTNDTIALVNCDVDGIVAIGCTELFIRPICVSTYLHDYIIAYIPAEIVSYENGICLLFLKSAFR